MLLLRSIPTEHVKGCWQAWHAAGMSVATVVAGLPHTSSHSLPAVCWYAALRLPISQSPFSGLQHPQSRACMSGAYWPWAHAPAVLHAPLPDTSHAVCSIARLNCLPPVLRKRDDGSLAVGTFCWKDEAITAAKAARNSRKSQTRAARKASTEPEDVSLDAEPATDAEAKVSIASVGVASVGATRKAGAAVRTAAAKPSYGRDPGMYDPASLLEVAPEISGKLDTLNAWL